MWIRKLRNSRLPCCSTGKCISRGVSTLHSIEKLCFDEDTQFSELRGLEKVLLPSRDANDSFDILPNIVWSFPNLSFIISVKTQRPLKSLAVQYVNQLIFFVSENNNFLPINFKSHMHNWNRWYEFSMRSCLPKTLFSEPFPLHPARLWPGVNEDYCTL